MGTAPPPAQHPQPAGPAQPPVELRRARGLPRAVRRDRPARRLLPARRLAAVHRGAAVHDDGRVRACTCRWAPSLPAAVAGAVLGAQAGYLIGVKAGPPLLDRPGRPRLQQAVTRARSSLERYGAGKAIVLARFIPLVRTVLNPLAGTVGVPVRTFTFWQVLGGVVWSAGRDPGRLRARLPHPERRHLPPADHRRHRRALPGPGPAGAAPLPQPGLSTGRTSL